MNSPPDTAKGVETHYFRNDSNLLKRVLRQRAGNSLLAEVGLSGNRISGNSCNSWRRRVWSKCFRGSSWNPWHRENL